MTSQVDAFVAKYSPEIAAAIQACRKKLRKLVPRGYELIYDNYNALAIGYAPSEKASTVVISIAAYPRWVTLFFLKGTTLLDPHGLLQGSGSRVRSIRLTSPADLDNQNIRSLMVQALAPQAEAFDQAPKVKAMIKSVSAKQRPRRPAG